MKWVVLDSRNRVCWEYEAKSALDALKKVKKHSDSTITYQIMEHPTDPTLVSSIGGSYRAVEEHQYYCSNCMNCFMTWNVLMCEKFRDECKNVDLNKCGCK